jgi:hypothetical protein
MIARPLSHSGTGKPSLMTSHPRRNHNLGHRVAVPATDGRRLQIVRSLVMSCLGGHVMPWICLCAT